MQPSYRYLWTKRSSTFKPLFSTSTSRRSRYSNIQRQEHAYKKPQHTTLQLSKTGQDRSPRCCKKPTRTDLLDKANYRTFPSFLERLITKTSDLRSSQAKPKQKRKPSHKAIKSIPLFACLNKLHTSLILNYLLLPDSTASFPGSILRQTTHLWPDFFSKRKLESWAVFTYLKLIDMQMKAKRNTKYLNKERVNCALLLRRFILNLVWLRCINMIMISSCFLTHSNCTNLLQTVWRMYYCKI